MSNAKITYGLVGFLIGVVSGWLLADVVAGDDGYLSLVHEEQQSAPVVSIAKSQLDAHFIEQMIPHHEDAVVMAELALQRSTNATVRQLAEDIIRMQQAEIEQMSSWYEDWYGRSLPTGDQVMQHHGMMSGGSLHMSVTNDDLQVLEESTDFDRAFVMAMIPHHQMAVMMTSMMLQGTERPEMRELGDAVIEAQSREIDMMRSWLEDGTL